MIIILKKTGSIEKLNLSLSETSSTSKKIDLSSLSLPQTLCYLSAEGGNSWGHKARLQYHILSYKLHTTQLA